MPVNEINWWENLAQEWKLAFGTVFFKHGNKPDTEELQKLFASPVLRFAGPRAPYPNMGFELTTLEGVTELVNLEILVVTHHQLKSVRSLQSLTRLKSLFLFNNEITSLQGIEHLSALEQLYVQYNKIDSLKPIKQLHHLKEVYINDNRLTSLDGLTEDHSENLTTFFCKPNAIKQKEIIHAENHLGIRCRAL